MDESKPPAPASSDQLPFSNWWPIVAGALSGVTLRLVYSGNPYEAYAPMMGGFIYLAPAVVGAVTIFLAERKARRSVAYYVAAPVAANILFVLGTMAIMIEGFICAFVIVPLFCVLGAIAGLLMGAICRLTKRPKRALYGIGVLPFILGTVEADLGMPTHVGVAESIAFIEAPPQRVWSAIVDVPAVPAEKIGDAWMFRIGVPLTMSGSFDDTSGERLRRVKMGKGIHFTEVITDWSPPHFLRWTYRYDADSFPKHALDEHVVLGGHYFDIQDTSYTLTPHGAGTRVHMKIHYRVSTRFNWYARPVADFLLTNLAETNLAFYRDRSVELAR